MRITITIDTDTNDIKVVNDAPMKPEVVIKPEVPEYKPLPRDYYTHNTNQPFITPVFSEYN